MLPPRPGYVILIPLAAATFLALGRHPMAGPAAAFSGVSGGFGANFVITSVDPVLLRRPRPAVGAATRHYVLSSDAM